MAKTVQRVISVLPSATEILCAIGGRSLLVGRSHEDNYPPGLDHIPIVTAQKTVFTSPSDVNRQVAEALGEGKSLYALDEELIKKLRPDVILTQDICSVCAIDLMTVERLAASMENKPTIITLNPLSLPDVLDNILTVGRGVGLEAQAQSVYDSLMERIDRAKDKVPTGAQAIDVAFVEWPDPLYVGGHWTPQMIHWAGGNHPLNPAPEPSKGGAGKSFAVPFQQLQELDPEVIIFCFCGLDLEMGRKMMPIMAQNSPLWRQLRAVQHGKAVLVDGDAMFNRPGPRLVDAFEWLVGLLHGREDAYRADFPFEEVSSLLLHKEDQDEQAKRREEEVKALTEIEEAHRTACAQGRSTYADPATGYTVFTEASHLRRGKCCGNACRHCPYGHLNVLPEYRKNKVKQTVYMQIAAPAPPLSAERDQQVERKDLILLGPYSSLDTIEQFVRERGSQHAVLVAPFFKDSQRVSTLVPVQEAESGNNGKKVARLENGKKKAFALLVDVMDVAKRLGCDMIALLVAPEEATEREKTDLCCLVEGLEKLQLLAKEQERAGKPARCFLRVHFEVEVRERAEEGGKWSEEEEERERGEIRSLQSVSPAELLRTARARCAQR